MDRQSQRARESRRERGRERGRVGWGGVGWGGGRGTKVSWTLPKAEVHGNMRFITAGHQYDLNIILFAH